MTTGIEFTFTHVAVGTGTSAASAANTALEHEIARFPIAGGGMVTGGHAVSINALITNHANANPQNYNISEIGFYGVDGANNTILFAICRQNTTIISKVSGADISLPFVLGLAALPVNNMTVQIDTNTSQTLALMGQHTAANHPHTQYKRRLDNTERMKLAEAVDGDEAIRKDTLDALRVRLIANGIDADLSLTNHIANIDTFITAGAKGYYNNDTIGDKPSTYGVVSVYRENSTFIYQMIHTSTNLLITRYSSNGGVDWAERITANESGDSSKFFSVKTATNDDHAPTYKQLVDGLSAVGGAIPSISGKADLAGNSTQLFSAADGVSGKNVVNKDQLDTKAALAGNSTQLFSAADGVSGKNVVNKDQLDTKAALAGNNAQVFKVAAAAAAEDAIRLDQLTAMSGAIKIALLQAIYPVGTPYFNKTNNSNPNTIFGVTVGTWVQEKGRFLVGFDDTQEEFDLLADTGGAKSHAMTLANLIEHDHNKNADGLEESVNVDSSGTLSGHYSPGANYLKLYTKTGKTGSATPTPIPTTPPYVVYSWWVRTA
jgi:hypothetical protein